MTMLFHLLCGICESSADDRDCGFGFGPSLTGFGYDRKRRRRDPPRAAFGVPLRKPFDARPSAHTFLPIYAAPWGFRLSEDRRTRS